MPRTVLPPNEYIAPHKMRRIFKMRDPYAVLIARHWARDLATIECILLGLAFFALAYGVSWEKQPPWERQHEGDDYLNDNLNDDLKVGGVHVTGQLQFRSDFEWAMFALIPWIHKGLLVFVDVLAILCSCQGACIATCYHRQLWCCDEKGILRTMSICIGTASVVTGLSVAGTSIILFIKWQHAMGKGGDITSTLLFMTLYGVASMLLMYLRVSATFKANTAHQVLTEEIIDV